MSEIKIVIRDSNLSEKQAIEAIKLFNTKFNFEYKIIKIKSFGDKNKKISLLTNKIDDIWTRELDQMILKEEADIAIHSAKDLPINLKDGLELIALLPYLDNTDALVSRNNLTLDMLPLKAKIGTSSLLRKNQILNYRKDLKIIDIRGTIEERIKLVDIGKIDALVVATCALKRLGLEDRIAQILPFKTHPLQGSLGVVTRNNYHLNSFFKQFDIRNSYGELFLVGAGTGEKDLLTIKGFKILKKADVIFYDDLIDKNLLNYFDCKKIFVGKRKNYSILSQEEINESMYKEIIQGKNVVRIKSGDPFIFGRGYEEFMFFKERFIDVTVIPGITAALTLSSYSNIPLTCRGISSSIGIFTGHKEKGKTITNFKNDTFVFYMASSNFKEIAKKLKKYNFKKDSLVAVIQKAGYYNQREYIYKLDDIIKKSIKIESPSIIIVGNVVKLYNPKYSYSNKKKILYTGTDPQLYENLGEIYNYPLIKIKSITVSEEIKKTLNNIEKYKLIIFTSKFGVKYFFEILLNNNIDIRSLKDKKIVTIGQRTAMVLKRYGIIPEIISDTENSNGLLQKLKNFNIRDSEILLPCSNLSNKYLKNELEKMGNSVDQIVVYENVFNEKIQKIDLTYFYGIIFTSSSTVHYFKKLYESIPNDIIIFVKNGPTKDTFKKEYSNEKIEII